MSTQAYNLPKGKNVASSPCRLDGCLEQVFLFRDILKFAEGSKRLVTGGMDAGGVLAICLTWREEGCFKGFGLQKASRGCFYKKRLVKALSEN